MSTAAKATHAPEVRVALLEGSVQAIQASVNKLEETVEHQNASINTSLNKIMAELGARPRVAPYREIIGAVAATLASLVIIAGFMQWWLAGAMEPSRRDLSRIERTVEPGEFAVLKYRLAQLELQAGTKK
jgi:hypothetical protein